MNELEKKIEELMNILDSKSMGNINEAQQMETIEKKLKAKIDLLVSKNLNSTNIKLQELGEGITKLNKLIRDNIDSNDKFARETKNYYSSLKLWSIVLGIATAGLVLVGGWQGCNLNIYTKETQKLVSVAQEQLDLQLQPALMITIWGLSDSPYKNIDLINIGNGVALNILVTSEDKSLQFVDTPSLLLPKEEKSLYYIEGSIDLSKKTDKDLRQLEKISIDLGNKKEFKIRIDYENIKNKKYFTLLTVNIEGVKLIERGEVKDR